jgi:hypothetical protein
LLDKLERAWPFEQGHYPYHEGKTNEARAAVAHVARSLAGRP